MGADTLRSFTVVPAFGGYFRSVKAVTEFTPERVSFALRKGRITLEGENLEVAEYFEEDVLIRGDVKVIRIE